MSTRAIRTTSQIVYCWAMAGATNAATKAKDRIVRELSRAKVRGALRAQPTSSPGFYTSHAVTFGWQDILASWKKMNQ